jgi:glycolate oxidase subunit GlcD
VSSPVSSPELAAGIRAAFGAAVLEGTPSEYLTDFTRYRGRADAVVLPHDAEEVAAVLAWCYERDVPITPRGGGTGVSAGAVPDGGVLLALDRLDRVRAFDPELWRIHAEAGVTTAHLQELVRKNGLMFAPDPGAPAQSQIGGNVATNAGGPHAFRYGVVGDWVTGVEAAVPPGELVAVGGAIRKDVSGYDLKHLLVGSEGTLGIVTAAWLKLLPAPELVLPVAVFHESVDAGCEALLRVIGSGIQAAALDVLDGATLDCGRALFPGGMPDGAGFLLMAEADGSREEAERIAAELVEVAGKGSLGVYAPRLPEQVRALWEWRGELGISIRGRRGGAISEDIVVPVDRLADAMNETIEIGLRHGLEAFSFGHGGDGNLHSGFFLDPAQREELAAAKRAAGDLFELAARMGGSVSGEHGLGLFKRGQLARQWNERALGLHAEIKRVFDPKNLLNPGKKLGVADAPELSFIRN